MLSQGEGTDEFRCIQPNDPIIGCDADLFVVPITMLPVFPSLGTNCQPTDGPVVLMAVDGASLSAVTPLLKVHMPIFT